MRIISCSWACAGWMLWIAGALGKRLFTLCNQYSTQHSWEPTLHGSRLPRSSNKNMIMYGSLQVFVPCFLNIKKSWCREYFNLSSLWSICSDYLKRGKADTGFFLPVCVGDKPLIFEQCKKEKVEMKHYQAELHRLLMTHKPFQSSACHQLRQKIPFSVLP